MRASLSFDADNKWSYMKTHGDSDWSSFPSYLDTLVPRVLNVLDEHDLQITFFIVGQDAALTYNREALSEIAARGHEIGNHSFCHEPWMHRRSEEEIDDEIARAEDSIFSATGHVPRGFRGPGFVCSDTLRRVLVRRGYRYDASSLPTFIGPLARAYYFRSSKLSPAQRREREDLFGSFWDGLAPNHRHALTCGNQTIMEIPVTTMPLVKIPIHLSYVLYIATRSPSLALSYFKAALTLCRLTGTEPSILLHPLDFLSAKECPELQFFPAMTLDPGIKRHVMFGALTELVHHFSVGPLQNFAVPGDAGVRSIVRIREAEH